MDHVALFLRVFFGTLFVSSAITKWVDPMRFRMAVAGYALLPIAFVPVTSLSIMVVESAVSVSLLAGWQIPVFAMVGALMMIVFTAAIAVNLTRGRMSLECGCGGLAESQTISWWLVIRNGLFCIGVLALTQLPPGPLAAANRFALTAEPFSLLVVAALAITCLLAMSLAGQLISLHKQLQGAGASGK